MKYKITLDLAYGNKNMPLRKGDLDEMIEILKKASDGERLNVNEQIIAFEAAGIISGIKKHLGL
ncbi:MAG: hypothetical protein BV456_00640 [Thermoplasmata archaeon M8B2D]|nr:MAG: hypothetical protein BV456_00640 [Thermoplasmata archaeon M8B2D]